VELDALVYKEREMENAYQKTLGRPENYIFIRSKKTPRRLPIAEALLN